MFLTYFLTLFLPTGFALQLDAYPFNRPEISNFVTYIQSSSNLSAKFASADNYTILAPTNDAINIWLSNNYTSGLVNATVQYHLFQGVHSSSALGSGTQLLTSSLTDVQFCNVTGGQRLESLKRGGDLIFESWLKNTSRILSPDLLADGGIVHIIDTVLEVPSGVFDTLPRTNLSYAVEIITKSNLLSGENFNVAESIGWNRDVTFFIPNSAAAVANFNTTGRNQDDLNNQLSYHCVDRLLYEQDFTNGSVLPTLIGTPIEMTIDQDGSVYVNSAKVIESNYLVDNGVMHIIDDILDPNNITHHTPNITFPAASSTASTATHSVTPTNSATAKPKSSNEKGGLSTGAKAGIGAGTGALVLALAIGGLLFYQRRKKSQLQNETKPTPEFGTEKNPTEISSHPLEEIPQLQTIESPVEMLGDIPRKR